MTRPIVFLTDYGTADEFVGVCHGVIARIAPDARVIDLSHAVARHDVLQGSVMLARAVPFMPADAVWFAVVDPGVGSERRAIAVETATGAHLVGPDNGLLSGAWTALGGATRAVEITSDEVLLAPVSRTFHGRDVFAPAAARLAGGWPLQRLGPAIDASALRTVDAGTVGARVVAVDGFGNVQLNARPADLDAAGIVRQAEVSGRRVVRVATFADVPRGDLALIVDSQGFAALVVNGGSASERLGLRPGDAVVLS